MINDFLIALDWVIISLSFFNTIAFLWLGLTVLLNAEQRRWGTWAAGGGLLLGGVFFAGHSVVVSHDLTSFSPDTEFWWHVSWLPVVTAPYMWYLISAWYTGVLAAGRHRVWLVLVTVLGLGALLSLVVANPLPSYTDVIARTPLQIFLLGGVPVAMLVYPLYSTLCIVLALLALWRPEASERFMGDEARKRARPWLIAASIVLITVTLILGIAVTVFLSRVQMRLFGNLPSRTLILMMAFDLLILALIAVAIVLIGRAIVSYEIFTGKTLPRGGLRRYWQRSLVLAAGYGAFMGLSLSLPGIANMDPLYRLMLATILMTLFYALLSWRSYADRERSMDDLRPFVASQQLYERMLRPTDVPDMDIAQPFYALCADVLGAQVAYLAAVGPLAPLVGAGLTYVDAHSIDRTEPLHDQHPLPFTVAVLADLAATMHSPQTMCIPLTGNQYGGAVWAVPLWSERGLIGILLLGHKRDGGLYTQEEIEIARATGERLIDTQASAEMARRLMSLQRQRLAESQVLDRRTRRVLHDDVLPQLHTAMLMLGTQVQPNEQIQNVVAQLADAHRQIANLLHDMPATAAPEVARLGLIDAVHQAIDSEFANAFDAVHWTIEPTAAQAARTVPALAAEVFFYAAREVVRNAARYGRNGDTARTLHLSIAVSWRNGLEMIIEDNGVGIGNTNVTQGSGHGLGLHSTLMAVVGGTLTTESKFGSYTRVALALPQAIMVNS